MGEESFRVGADRETPLGETSSIKLASLAPSSPDTASRAAEAQQYLQARFVKKAQLRRATRELWVIACLFSDGPGIDDSVELSNSTFKDRRQLQSDRPVSLDVVCCINDAIDGGTVAGLMTTFASSLLDLFPRRHRPALDYNPRLAGLWSISNAAVAVVARGGGLFVT